MASDSAKSVGNYQPGYEVVAERLKLLIVESGLQPGSKLPTVDALSAQLGVGRKVVLEALRLLSAGKYVRVRRGSGVYVADRSSPEWATIELPLPLDPAEVFNLFVFRQTLEEQTARMAAENSTPRELRAIGDAVDRSRRGAETNDRDEFSAGDFDLHAGIAAASHNPFLASSVATVYRLQHEAINIVLLGNIPGSMVTATEQHQVIYDAVKAGQADAAALGMRRHIETTTASYRAEVRRLLVNTALSGEGRTDLTSGSGGREHE